MEAKKETNGCIRWGKLIRNKRKGKKITHDNSNVLLPFSRPLRDVAFVVIDVGILFQTSVTEIS